MSDRKRDYRKRIFRKNSMPDGMSRWLQTPFKQDERRIYAEMNRKAYRKSPQNTCNTIGGMCHRRQSVPRKLYPLFATVSSHLFFSGFRSSLSFDLSLVGKDTYTCFHSKHSEEASPCNNTTVNTKRTRPISSSNSYGVSFCHSYPSLKAT